MNFFIVISSTLYVNIGIYSFLNSVRYVYPSEISPFEILVYKLYFLPLVSILSSNFDNIKNLLAGGVSGAINSP